MQKKRRRWREGKRMVEGEDRRNFSSSYIRIFFLSSLTTSRSLPIDHRGHQLIKFLYPRVLLKLAQRHKHVSGLREEENDEKSKGRERRGFSPLSLYLFFSSALFLNELLSLFTHLLCFCGMFHIKRRNVFIRVSQSHILKRGKYLAYRFHSFMSLTSRGTRARKRKVSPSGSCSMLKGNITHLSLLFPCPLLPYSSPSTPSSPYPSTAIVEPPPAEEILPPRRESVILFSACSLFSRNQLKENKTIRDLSIEWPFISLLTRRCLE